MIVEDEPDIIKMLTALLEKRHLSYHAFRNPNEALKQSMKSNQNYQLVIVDIRLPHMSGFDFVNSVRPLCPNIKILLMSAYETSGQELITILEGGRIDGFMRKPFSLEQFERWIAKCLPQYYLSS